MTTPGKYIGVATDSPALDAPTANSLTATNITVQNLTAASETIPTSNITTANITTGNITTANITTEVVTTSTITTAGITTANVGVLNTTGIGSASAANAVSAAGTNQATATPLTKKINNVSTVGSGTGVNLPASAAGVSIIVQNNGANPLTVYPAQGASDTINGLAATVGVKLVVGSVATFNATAAGAWTVEGLPSTAAAFNTNSATTTAVLTAANITGGFASVDLQMTGTMSGDANAQLPLATAMLAAMANATASASFRLRITNASSADHVWTVVTNTGWTLTGTMTIAQNTWREFVVLVTSTSTAILQNVADGTYS